MTAQDLLQEIAIYCRRTGLAESTFGRRAVNNGKLAARLRNCGRITTETVARIRAFMENNRPEAPRSTILDRAEPTATRQASPPLAPPEPRSDADPQRNFRFFDNRQKYLLS